MAPRLPTNDGIDKLFESLEKTFDTMDEVFENIDFDSHIDDIHIKIEKIKHKYNISTTEAMDKMRKSIERKTDILKNKSKSGKEKLKETIVISNKRTSILFPVIIFFLLGLVGVYFFAIILLKNETPSTTPLNTQIEEPSTLTIPKTDDSGGVTLRPIE